MRFVTTAGMKELERQIAQAGVSYPEMMERAGQSAAKAILERWPVAGKRVLVLCGKGNNDGLQQGVHVGLLAGDEPVAVAVGVFHQLGPAAVEELQHLLEATVLQAAHLHVLHDEAHLQRRGDAPGPSAEGPAGLAGQ